MRDNDRLEGIVRKDLNVRASNETYDRMRDIVLDAHGPSRETESATTLSIARRKIMRSPIVKFAVAAAVAAAVLVGATLFRNSGSGVVWAEVTQKVDASQGVIFRVRTAGSQDPNDDWPNAYMTTRRSPRYSRTDWYRGDQARRTICFNLDTRTVLWLAHDARVYFTRPLTEEDVQSIQREWTDPKGLLDLLMSHEYKELGRKTIDGVVCEGIETTDPAAAGANFPVKSFVGRMWVSVETGYPVLAEMEIGGGNDGTLHQKSMGDQFRWNVDLSAEGVEPEIPADYEPL